MFPSILGMAHQLQLEKKKYRQWVKAGLGLGYLKEGLAPFCDDVAKQQHKDILDNIKQTKNLSTVTCGQCTLRTLKPDHVKTGNKQCPLGQANCNCCYTSGKTVCPNNVCGAIYDNILTNHASTPPAPNWKNTLTQQWIGDPWSIAKSFINAPGYDRKTSAAEIDCTGLLHVIINNKYFHNHIQCNLAGSNVFSKVRQYRNKIFHSSTMELEEEDANTYINDMIAVLQDGKELINLKDAQEAVKKLDKLKKDDLIITTKSEADVIHTAVQSISDTIDEVENKLRNKTENIPTTEVVEGLETRVTLLELDMAAVKEEMKELKTTRSTQRNQYSYIKSKLEFQEKLMSLYRQSLLQVSAIPLHPERKHCNFSEVYVRPRITYEIKDVRGRPLETEIQSMSDIFTKDGIPQKSIYVLGDAGSGKSSFCKRLVNAWCLAHSKDQHEEDEDTFDEVKEMKKFEFVFYISLRHCKYDVGIQEMLERQFKEKMLQNTLLKEESAKVLILLDGLDEWSPNTVSSYQFQTEGLPERDLYKEYVVITTSRPWKLGTLGITDKEIDQKLKLKGLDESSVEEMIDNTVLILNHTFKKDKDSRDCKNEMADNNIIKDIDDTPIIIQQLICLWFDDKLHEHSRCAIYTGMLDLFFKWNVKKYPDFIGMRKKSSELRDVQLPEILIKTEECKYFKYIIQGVSRLAYETLFSTSKEMSLTFGSSVFEKLQLDSDIKECCLKLGIFSEDRCPSLSASISDSLLLSFVHKSVQEYLAALHITIKFKASADLENAELSGHCEQLIKELFSMCTTLDEILEQANVFIMLCGLEPRIATSISKYIYDIVTRDKRVLEYRRTIDDEYRHENIISNTQKCILNCIEEVQVCQTNIMPNFYVGDLIVQSESDCDHFRTGIDKQCISADSVRSFRVDPDEVEEYLKTVLQYLPRCRQLEAIHIDASIGSYEMDDEDIKYICGAIEHNTSTLNSLFICFKENDNLKPMYKTIVCSLPDMSHLVALHVESFSMPHEDLTSLCSFLSGSSHLEQISIFDIRCETSTDSMLSTDDELSSDSECSLDIEFNIASECRTQHVVDLSKHQQLQYLRHDDNVMVTGFNTSNLDIFIYKSLNSTHFLKVFDILSTTKKLTKLELWYDNFNISTHIVGSDKNPSYHTVTDKLITLLPLLYQLRDLRLEELRLTDNIIKCPNEMKSMKIIDLGGVRMSLTTWRQFVDSLLLMPLPVEVRAWNMCITWDGEEYHPELDQGKEGDGVAAWQYVREQKALFNMKYEKSNSIYFSTKKYHSSV
ncbi:uncharacterized protein LOC123566709 [Mercenaria mercenaria]|uniref:uncharacterized protein LOC123566709 n=1 Tax=Mercenaria mercenaria TaxID=6596 RepID=UPI00234EC6EA|nr:uncharacterized protein LOC123566709 [Mercenaria mercenaria]